ncbi:MAG: tRNA (N6-isopentenyl adenosine(37)-C2)-methylthiotransferase MiaB [Polyangiaceae bacterium]
MENRYFLQTFGCQMNVHDSERLAETLGAHGWKETDSPAGADLVIFNTCSVREKAEQKLRSEVGKLAQLKKARPDLVICVAGCVAQQEGEKLLERVRHIDIVIGPDNLSELPALVEEQRQGSMPRARTVFEVQAPVFLSAAPKGACAPASAFVTTMKGCDERCSFCVVPYTRGPERYRPAAEIVAECKRWVDAGAKEIVLLGQTVDSFRDSELPPPANENDPDESQFPALLEMIANRVPGLARLRYTSPHPRHLTPSLIEAHATLDVLAHHVHMPVQSGCDRILKRMIRRYTRAEYIDRISRLKKARSDMSLSTDIIVGFPGETEEDFQQTLSLVAEVGFTSAFAFKFSPRPLTPALKLADDVTEEEKSDRLARLLALVESQGRAHLATLVGTRATVLVEGASKSGDFFQGRTERNEIVHLPAGAFVRNGKALDPSGQLVMSDVTSANKHSLEGAPLAASLDLLPLRGARMKSEARSLPVLSQ